MAAGVRVTQREQKPRPGRETARQWGEEQPNLSPKVSEDEAMDMGDSMGAVLCLEPFPGDPLRGCCLDLLSYLVAWAKKCRGSLLVGLSLLMVKRQRSRAG